jgi:predicted dehydrogenase
VTRRIALIGVGPMAALHVPAIRSTGRLEVVSCASRSLERARAFAQEHGIARGRLVDEVLAQPEADALWLVAPAAAMADVAASAAACGVPLFLEKPVGLSVAESETAARAVDVPHMVGLNRRFYEVLQRGRDLLLEAGGARFLEVHMPEDVRPLVDVHDDRVIAAWPFANSIHLIDLFRFLGGEVIRIRSANRPGDPTERGYASLLELEGGARGAYHAQWFAPGRWRVAAYAEGLSITFAPIERGLVQRFGEPARELEPEGPDREIKAGLAGQALAFARLLETGQLPPDAVDLDDYCRSVRLVASLTGAAGGAPAPETD